MHSNNFERIKKWYNQGIWSEDKVRNAVEKNQITPEEFEEITGKPYSS